MPSTSLQFLKSFNQHSMANALFWLLPNWGCPTETKASSQWTTGVNAETSLVVITGRRHVCFVKYSHLPQAQDKVCASTLSSIRPSKVRPQWQRLKSSRPWMGQVWSGRSDVKALWYPAAKHSGQ
jgi:hypothetical protein